MGFKEEMRREIRNVIRDVEKEAHKTWDIDYKGHSIQINHQLKEEHLIIDGVTVDSNKRKYLLSHLMPYSRLSGVLDLGDGKKHKVSVKIGGFSRFNCIVKIGREKILAESLKLDFLPWNHKEKIVPFIHRQVEAHNRIIDERLPDDEYLYDENQPRMAAGLADHLADDMPTPLFAGKLVRLLEKQLKSPTDKTRKATYEAITSDNIASYGEQFIMRFEEAELDPSLVQQEAMWLLEHAAHREVVKFALTVLGCTNCEDYKERLVPIGLHEEFTSYVIFALRNGTREGNHYIWQLAQSVHGWGRMAAVEQLEPATPEIKHWLLTKGCENSLMNGHIAYTCAVKGELASALYQETISKELYDGAGLIIQELLDETEEKAVDDYLFENAILYRFVSHACTHCDSLDDFYPLLKIAQFLADEEVWEEQADDAWKQGERRVVQKLLEPLIHDSKWPRLSVEALQHDFHEKALEIASFYQLDIISQLFKLLERYPANSEIYFAIMDTQNRQHIIRLCEFAEQHLTLSDLSDDEEDCLRFIVGDLHDHEDVGLPLILAALESDIGVLQYQALSVLQEWTPASWNQPAVLAAIQNIAATAGDKVDRKLASQLLAK
ncbi:hypothetical protein [Paenibacillus dakarensis]|uniref:hypothetical protein n=1 Tax=Paenibacillus dakarensis TaxID=1527293 RepID=UPI0006D548D5|nr:hypothetical protein [Paenibacillus dakarensis]